MPCRGSNEGSVFLQDKQTFKFSNPQALPQTITDRDGRTWQLHSGILDATEKNYGIFDNGKLVAHVTLIAPEMDDDCPTLFWIIGRIAVATAFQKRGIGPALVTAARQLHGAPLASDLNQQAGGASMWERLILPNPGKIELHDGQCGSQPINVIGGRLVPDPWAHHDKRLVRRF